MLAYVCSYVYVLCISATETRKAPSELLDCHGPGVHSCVYWPFISRKCECVCVYNGHKYRIHHALQERSFGAIRTCPKICMCWKYVISIGVISHDNAGVLCSDEIVELQLTTHRQEAKIGMS